MKNVLNFLKGAGNGAVSTVDVKRPVRELVQEIHETFYTEVDRLLVEAGLKEALNVDTDAIEKMKRLRELGFVKAADVRDASDMANQMADMERRNKERRELEETIRYFSQKYPMYRFITEESVSRICDEYGLVYGPVGNYLGNVPDKNLEDIENFSIDDDDVCVVVGKHTFSAGTLKDLKTAQKKYIDYIERDSQNDHLHIMSGRNGFMHIGNFRAMYAYEKCQLEIAAPLKDFDTTDMVLSKNKLERKIEIPDPVVLQPVFHNGKKHYLIVTAWGDEASDPEVMNPMHN